MKKESICYVFMKIGNIEIDKETMFLTSDYKFTNNICDALKARNRKTALHVRCDYEETQKCGYESGLEIVPLKITYEW